MLIFKNGLVDLSLIIDMDVGVDWVCRVIEEFEKVFIFGDYDVDGVIFSVFIKRYFEDIGVEVLVYIFDWLVEGYGLFVFVFEKFVEEWIDLIIMLDCGMVVFDLIEVVVKGGIDVIVIDYY